jgi:hypothetical protein
MSTDAISVVELRRYLIAVPWKALIAVHIAAVIISRS